jgi:Mn2+/Fe2+ NRAMP family transporter
MARTGRYSALIGAVFLMGVSAIGPGFLTQTATFTAALGASFGFTILISIILDIGAQLNIWRVIIVSNKRGQDVANAVVPGLGHMVAIFVIMGGLAFNIGNVAGAGLGVQVLLPGLSVEVGAIISAGIAIAIFLFKEAGKIMDKFVQYLGILMILLTIYVVFASQPPLAEAALRTFVPETIDIFSIVTLVGGTVGGYITFAGAHRLLDSGIHGEKYVPMVNKGSISGIMVTAVMRAILFLAVLGVVYQGFVLDPKNPVASVFQHAAGDIGYKIFGVVMWVAAITSVIGAAYTSVTFMRSFSPKVEKNQNWLIIVFIIISTAVFVLVGRPVLILVLVGAINGLILPLTLGPILIAAYKKSVVGEYRHPVWMTVFGAIVVVLMSVLGVRTIIQLIAG